MSLGTAERSIPTVTWPRFCTAVMCCSLLFTAMPSLSVSKSPFVTIGDLFFALDLVLLFPVFIRSRFRAPVAYYLGSLTLITMGLLSMVVVQDPLASQNFSRMLYALVIIPLLFALWQPSLPMTAAMSASYILGTAISVLDGLMTGPGADGRTLGLTPHPNALGATCVLSIALVPFAMRMAPRARWVLWATTALLLYGIWISGSRGSLLALGVLLLIITVVEQSVPLAGLLASAGIAVIITSSSVANSHSNNALTRLFGGGTSGDATGQRQQAIDTALRLINDHPLLGAGFNQIRSAQSAFLQIAAALGIIALIAFCAVLLALCLPALRRQGPARYLAYAAVGYIGLAITSDSVWDTIIWAPISLGIVGALPHSSDPVAPQAEAAELAKAW